MSAHLDEEYKVEGTPDLCAWAVEEGVCWVQSRHPEYVRAIQRVVETRIVGYGVGKGYLRILEVKRTLPWVARELVSKIPPQFPKVFEGSKSETPLGLASGKVSGKDGGL